MQIRQILAGKFEKLGSTPIFATLFFCAAAADYVMTVATLNEPLGAIRPESEALRVLSHGRLGLR